MKRLLCWKALSTVIPYSRTHIYRLEANGSFPRRVQVGRKRVAWLESEIDDWIEKRERAIDIT